MPDARWGRPDPRWVREESRTRWVALDPEQRDEVFRAARRGEPCPDLELALSAVHWSWAVLGRPGARRSYPWGDLFMHYAPKALFENIYNGTRQHDIRYGVRREARRVENANLPHLNSLGIDTGL
jgi:hypothetical protein